MRAASRLGGSGLTGFGVIICTTGAGGNAFAQVLPQAKARVRRGIRVACAKKSLDTLLAAPYPTPSMSTVTSTEMLKLVSGAGRPGCGPKGGN